eukprot:1886606-Pleurochrysis_carterae.AAC.12
MRAVDRHHTEHMAPQCVPQQGQCDHHVCHGPLPVLVAEPQRLAELHTAAAVPCLHTVASLVLQPHRGPQSPCPAPSR